MPRPRRRLSSNGNGHAQGNPYAGIVDPILLNQRAQLVANDMTMRQDAFRRLLDPRRDVEEECGHPKNAVDPFTYLDLFNRDPIANRVCEVFPKECWQVQPLVYEDEDPETVTPFEEAWDELGKMLHGQQSWYQDEKGSPVWEALKRADILSGVGHYGVILLGLDDGKELSEPVAGVEEKGSTPAEKGKEPPKANQRYRLTANAEEIKGRQLLYLRCFPQAQADIVQYEANPSSPRYSQPVMYNLTFNDPRDTAYASAGQAIATKRVHWTRVIHVVDNVFGNEVFGVPRMRPVLPRLLDLQKIYGGDAEGYWKNVIMRLFLETHPQLGGDVDVDEASLKDMMENMENGLQRWAYLSGMSAKTVAPAVVDPTAHVAVQIEAICIKIGCPVRIFKGSERGELASTQDDMSWNDRVKERQQSQVTPRIIVPFVNRLILVGALPEPEGYSIEWPDITSQSAQEKATVAGLETTALSTYVQGGVEALIPPLDFLTSVMEYDEEEAKEMLENAEEAAAEKEQEDMLKQQELIEKGLAPDPTAQPEPGPIKMRGGDALVNPKDGGVVAERPFPPKPTRNVFCPTGPGGGVDPSCSPSQTAVSEARQALSAGDQKAIDSIIARVKEASSGRRSELGVKGLKELAKAVGVTGHSKLRKAGLSQAIQDKLRASKIEAPAKDLEDRVDRLQLAEKYSGIKYEDRLVNSVMAQTGVADSDQYRRSYADLRGDNPQAENVSYMNAARGNVLKDIREGNVPARVFDEAVTRIAEEGHGKLSSSEAREYVTRGAVSAPQAVTSLIPEDIQLQPAPKLGPISRGRAARAALKGEDDYIDRLRAPAKERMARIKELEGQTGTPFAAHVMHELLQSTKVDLPGRAEYLDKANRMAGGGHLTSDEKRSMSGFRAMLASKIKFEDIGHDEVVHALEAVDNKRLGTMKINEFLKSLSKKATRNAAAADKPSLYQQIKNIARSMMGG